MKEGFEGSETCVWHTHAHEVILVTQWLLWHKHTKHKVQQLHDTCHECQSLSRGVEVEDNIVRYVTSILQQTFLTKKPWYEKVKNWWTWLKNSFKENAMDASEAEMNFGKYSPSSSSSWKFMFSLASVFLLWYSSIASLCRESSFKKCEFEMKLHYLWYRVNQLAAHFESMLWWSQGTKTCPTKKSLTFKTCFSFL